MGGLQKNAQAANIRLKNTLNRFSLFSTSKFVENVYYPNYSYLYPIHIWNI